MKSFAQQYGSKTKKSLRLCPLTVPNLVCFAELHIHVVASSLLIDLIDSDRCRSTFCKLFMQRKRPKPPAFLHQNSFLDSANVNPNKKRRQPLAAWMFTGSRTRHCFEISGNSCGIGCGRSVHHSWDILLVRHERENRGKSMHRIARPVNAAWTLKSRSFRQDPIQ